MSTAGEAKTVDRAVQIIGAFAGLGALIYAVGASILWLRFDTTGFNADEALSVEAHLRIISLGLRWLLIWAIAVAALTALCVQIGGSVSRSRHLNTTAMLGDGRRVTVGTLVLAVSLAALVIGSAFVTWGAFTVAIDIAAVVAFVRWHVRSQRPIREHVRQLAVFVALMSALSAIGWQLEINLPYDHATYYVSGDSRRWDGIFFGEANGNVYVARRPPGTNQFFREISIYPESTIRGLTIRPGLQTLCTRVDRPSIAIAHFVVHLGDAISQHLRRTGQPIVISNPPVQNLPRGKCPSLP